MTGVFLKRAELGEVMNTDTTYLSPPRALFFVDEELFIFFDEEIFGGGQKASRDTSTIKPTIQTGTIQKVPAMFRSF